VIETFETNLFFCPLSPYQAFRVHLFILNSVPFSTLFWFLGKSFLFCHLYHLTLFMIFQSLQVQRPPFLLHHFILACPTLHPTDSCNWAYAVSCDERALSRSFQWFQLIEPYRQSTPTPSTQTLLPRRDIPQIICHQLQYPTQMWATQLGQCSWPRTVPLTTALEEKAKL